MFLSVFFNFLQFLANILIQKIVEQMKGYTKFLNISKIKCLFVTIKMVKKWSITIDYTKPIVEMK